MKIITRLTVIVTLCFSSITFGNTLGDSLPIQSNNIRCLTLHVVKPKMPANLEIIVDDKTAQRIGIFTKNNVGRFITIFLYPNGNFLILPISQQQIEAMSKDKHLINISNIPVPWESSHFQVTIAPDRISYVQEIIKKHAYVICK